MDDLEKIFSRSVVRTKNNRNPVAEIFRYAKRKVDGSLPCFPNQPEYNSRDTSHPKEFIWRAYMRLPKHIREHVKWCDECGIAKPRDGRYFGYNEAMGRFYPQCKDCQFEHIRQDKRNQQYENKTETARQRRQRERYEREWRRSMEWVIKREICKNASLYMRMLIKGDKGGRGCEKLLGYTRKEFVEHIESLFQPGMYWWNYPEWELDHVRPVSSFNFTSPDDEEFKKCWALNNLCPMWKADNIRKGAQYPYTLPPSRRHLYPNPCPYTENIKDEDKKAS